jgi:hypothetical protein
MTCTTGHTALGMQNACFSAGQKIVLNSHNMAELKRQRDLICKGYRLLGRDASIYLMKEP